VASRIDHLDNPDAPPANSLVPSVNVVVTDDSDKILLIRRTDNDNWALPGGAIDVGESITDAAVRETQEETGIRCQVTGLVGLYSNPRHVIEYSSDGEVRQEFSIVLIASAVGGSPTTSSESSEVAWTTRDEIERLPMHPSMRERISHYFRRGDQPYIR
jgi:ADP-ribose pyrophosphatase YjhB (NUDIX family)